MLLLMVIAIPIPMAIAIERSLTMLLDCLLETPERSGEGKSLSLFLWGFGFSLLCGVSASP